MRRSPRRTSRVCNRRRSDADQADSRRDSIQRNSGSPAVARSRAAAQYFHPHHGCRAALQRRHISRAALRVGDRQKRLHLWLEHRPRPPRFRRRCLQPDQRRRPRLAGSGQPAQGTTPLQKAPNFHDRRHSRKGRPGALRERQARRSTRSRPRANQSKQSRHRCPLLLH